MTGNRATIPPGAQQRVFHTAGENLYRLESSGGYYALAKKCGKQFRRKLGLYRDQFERVRLWTIMAAVAWAGIRHRSVFREAIPVLVFEAKGLD